MTGSNLYNRVRRLEQRDDNLVRYKLPNGEVVVFDAKEEGLAMFAAAVQNTIGIEEEEASLDPTMRAVMFGQKVDARGQPVS